MSRVRVEISNSNAMDVYQYFANALHEKRIFKEKPEILAEAQQAFLQITSTHEINNNRQLEIFKSSLQEWVDTYVPQNKWQRCLATLRQIRSNHRHEVKSVKLAKETYTLVKTYAELLQISLPQAIHKAIESLLQEFQTTHTLVEEPYITEQSEQNIQVKLWLRVENNNKFIRGKGKVLQSIERFLEEYNVKKSQHHDWEYILTIYYENDEDLDETIHEIYREMSFLADLRHCFIEADISTLGGEKQW